MTGRNEVLVTRELTVGAHVAGMPFVFSTPMKHRNHARPQIAVLRESQAITPSVCVVLSLR
jgi:hypothetical protein